MDLPERGEAYILNDADSVEKVEYMIHLSPKINFGKTMEPKKMKKILSRPMTYNLHLKMVSLN